MFEDKDGDQIIPFNCVSDFPLEGQHLLGGGVFKKLHTSLAFMATRVRIDTSQTKSFEKSLLDPFIEERVQFYNKYTLSEQARKLR
jgi:hypothetical protein